jgi:lipoprotein-releasing system permease protein
MTTVFIILVVFYMIISHKSKDIGILRSVGASSVDIVELFSGFALLIALIGSGIGLCAGWLFLWKINPLEDWLRENYGFELWNRSMYDIGAIPNRVDAHVLAIIVFSAIIACLCGALIPCIKSARENISETLQVNKL